MQKVIIILLLVISYGSIYGQRAVNFLKERETLWQNLELPVSNEIKNNLLASQGATFQDPLSLHLLYFNADTLPDGIYQYNGSVEFYLNKNQQLVKIGEDKGHLIGVQQNKPFEITTAHFLKKDCCNNGHGYYQQWLIIPDSTGMALRKLEKIYYAMDTEIPDYLNINLKFKLKERTVLQNLPINGSNIRKVAEYSTASRGYALCSKIDDKGSIWWFVIMEPKPQMADSSLNIRRMGWMPSNYLQVISH